jgi:hypothetical protein
MVIKLQLRLPEELHKEIKELAQKEKRSLNGQLVYMLETFIEQLKQADMPKPQK